MQPRLRQLGSSVPLLFTINDDYKSEFDHVSFNDVPWSASDAAVAGQAPFTNRQPFPLTRVCNVAQVTIANISMSPRRKRPIGPGRHAKNHDKHCCQPESSLTHVACPVVE